jgi:dUTP diphosphatase
VTAYQQTAASPAAGEGAAPTNPAVDAVPVLIKRLDQGLPLPARAHPGDAGVDLCTAVDVVLAPGERALVPTGMAVALPEGYAAFVHPRSGLAARHGVTLVNAPGTVDAGYRGEIKVTLINTDRTEPVRFERGDRIAQLVVQRVAFPQFHEVQTLPGSARGDGGFGSTGGHGAGQHGPGPVTEEPGRRPAGGSRGVAPPGQHGHGGDESMASQ